MNHTDRTYPPPNQQYQLLLSITLHLILFSYSTALLSISSSPWIVSSRKPSSSRFQLASSSSSSSLPSPSQIEIRSVLKVDRSQFDPLTHYYHTRPTTTPTPSDASTTPPPSITPKKQKQHNHNHTTIHIPFETPVLIENTLSSSECNHICTIIERELSNVLVDVQRKTTTTTDLIECSLEEAFDWMMKSRHNDAFFCFCEGLLQDVSTDSGDDDDDDEDPREPSSSASSSSSSSSSLGVLKDVEEWLVQVKERLFGVGSCDDGGSGDGGSDGGMEYDRTRNLFDFFPMDVQPSDCVVVAGEGATSTLHRDPFCWTGTSLCLEGTKVWRFIAPPGALEQPSSSSYGTTTTATTTTNDVDNDSGVRMVDGILRSYRLPSVAWGGDGDGDGYGGDDVDNDDENGRLYLSSGWQSDMSLYASRDETVPSAKELAFLDEENNDNYDDDEEEEEERDVVGEDIPKRKLKLLEEIASRLDLLTPSDDFPSCYLGNNNNNGNVHNDHKDQDDDCFSDETTSSSSSSSSSPPLTIYTVVQKPGDLLVIPAFWWHQTYALEPSLAIASQRSGNERDTQRVVSHIFDTVRRQDNDDNGVGGVEGGDYYGYRTLLPEVLRQVMDGTYTGSQEQVSSALFGVLSSM